MQKRMATSSSSSNVRDEHHDRFELLSEDSNELETAQEIDKKKEQKEIHQQCGTSSLTRSTVDDHYISGERATETAIDATSFPSVNRLHTSHQIISKKLFGRAKEEEAIKHAYAQASVAGGAKNVAVVITGDDAGVGKTAIAQSLRDKIGDGFFIEWKFTRFQELDKDEFIKSFSLSLKGQILNAANEMKQSTSASSCIVTLVDDLILRAVAAGEAERDENNTGVNVIATNQLDDGLKKLMQKLGDYPLAVLFDDVHWSSSCIQAFLRELVADSMNTGTLYVFTTSTRQGTFQKSPLMDFDGSVNVTTIVLECLNEEHSKLMIADALRVDPQSHTGLISDIHESTAGNPGFVNEMLRMMGQHGVLVFCEESETWEYKEELLDSVTQCEGFTRIYTCQMNQLSGKSREVLKAAACLGTFVDVLLLDLLTSGHAMKYLNEAIACGFLVPVDNLHASYRFANEGVLFAAYSLIPQDELDAFHLSIGCKVMQDASNEDRLSDEQLSKLLLLFKRGVGCATREKERHLIAALLLKASEYAVQASSFAVAAETLDFAITLVQDRCWRHDYDLSLTLYNRAAEVAYAVGAHTRVTQLVDVVLSEARTLDHKLHVYCTKISSLSAVAKLDEAIDLGREVLQQLNEPIRAHPSVPYILREYARIRYFMRNKMVDTVRRLKPMKDHRKAAAMQILNLLLLPVRLGRSSLAPELAFRMVRLTVTHGLCALSSVAFAMYGMVLTFHGSRYNEGIQYSELALELLERFDTKQWLPRVHAIVYGVTYGWSKDLSLLTGALQRGYEVGIESGDVEFALVNACLKCGYMSFRGDPLPIVKKELDEFTDEMDKLNQSSILIENLILKHEVVALMETDSLSVFNKAVVSDERLRGWTEEMSGHFKNYAVLSSRLLLSYLWRDYGRAAAAAELIDWAQLPMISIDMSLPFMLEATARLAHCKATAKDRRKALAAARRSLSRLKSYIKCQRRVFLGIEAFIAAEVAAFKGKFDIADKKYATSVALFEHIRMPIQYGIARDRAAIFARERGSDESARFYLCEAQRVFKEWGAKGKSDALSIEITELFGRNSG